MRVIILTNPLIINFKQGQIEVGSQRALDLLSYEDKDSFRNATFVIFFIESVPDRNKKKLHRGQVAELNLSSQRENEFISNSSSK